VTSSRIFRFAAQRINLLRYLVSLISVHVLLKEALLCMLFYQMVSFLTDINRRKNLRHYAGEVYQSGKMSMRPVSVTAEKPQWKQGDVGGAGAGARWLRHYATLSVTAQKPQWNKAMEDGRWITFKNSIIILRKFVFLEKTSTGWSEMRLLWNLFGRNWSYRLSLQSKRGKTVYGWYECPSVLGPKRLNRFS
jgi:hypothetical protein